jgi:hypothetical protein
MTPKRPQPIRCFAVPFRASWERKRIEKDVPVQTRNGIKKTGEVWSVSLIVNDREIVTGFGTSSAEAEEHCWELLQAYAAPHISDIRTAAKAVEVELRWTPAEAVALVFAFCRSELGPLAYAGLVRDDEKKNEGRGRSPTVTRTTMLIARMTNGWQWLTGREIGFSEDGWLPRAIEAVAKYCRLETRDGQPFLDIRNALRREEAKYATGLAIWAPTRMTLFSTADPEPELLATD